MMHRSHGIEASVCPASRKTKLPVPLLLLLLLLPLPRVSPPRGSKMHSSNGTGDEDERKDSEDDNSLFLLLLLRSLSQLASSLRSPCPEATGGEEKTTNFLIFLLSSCAGSAARVRRRQFHFLTEVVGAKKADRENKSIQKL